MLFEPVSISGLTAKNRIVRSATYEKRADEDGFATEELINMYEELARGGVGLIVTGVALVHPSGRGMPKMLSVHSDRYIDKLSELTGRVHAAGGVIALQLLHGGRQCPPLYIGGEAPMAPSEVPDTSTGITPRAMRDEEIWMIIEAFGEAARRGLAAGFDAVQIHAAHGYLVSSFLSPYTNRRDDYWGGDEERRFHFVEEAYKAMRAGAGKSFPLMIKMNGDDLLPGGITPGESMRAARRLEDMGIDAIEISGGMRESAIKTIRPGILKPQDEAYFRDIGALFKKNVSVPVIVTGGMRTRKVMEGVLKRGEADLAGMSRPLIRQPDLPKLFKQGREKADCISCNKCANFLKLDTVRCVALEEGA
ncbi:MAG: NADH:flavin oxidoreductase [Nitrospiraceae bacterium]|nr:NADH:flavin oxidoreductase [Nitrospiraceae bacterium]